MPRPELHFGFTLAGDISAVVEHAQLLETLRFEYVAWGEHYMRGNPPMPSTAALPPLAVAAGATKSIRLLSAILLLPLYHPTMLAKQTASLDFISGGRLTVGIGVGGEFPEEFEALEVPVNQRGSRANEALSLLSRLWTEEHVTHEGRHYRLRDVTLKPPPLQKPHPPIWVAGRRDAAMRRAVRYGDGWFPYLYSPARFKGSVETVQQFAAAEGKDLANFHWGLNIPVAIFDTVEEAAQAAASQLGGRYQAGTDFINLVGGICLLGPVEACIRRLQEYVDAGVRYFIFSAACEPQDVPRHMELLARQVIPHFRT